MSLKSRLRISIVALVAVVVLLSSGVYLWDFTRLEFLATLSRAELVESLVKGYVLQRIRPTQEPGATLAELKPVWTGLVRNDPQIPGMLEGLVANSDVILNIRITGEDGKTLASSSPEAVKPVLLPKEEISAVAHGNAFRALWDLLTRREDYISTLPLGVSQQSKPIFRITVVIPSTLLLTGLMPAFRSLGLAFFVAFATAMLLAFALPSLFLRPLDQISQQIDLIRTGRAEVSPDRTRLQAREFTALQSKLNLLGQQFRGAQQDALALRSNLQETLQRLEEAVLLFDASGQLMMAGQPAERLLGRTREELLGRSLNEVFPPSTALGAVVGNATHNNQPVHDQVVTVDHNSAAKTRVLVNVEILRKGAGQEEIATLVTLRDAETRSQIETQLEVSSRLAAISRLTSGVAHEIKNPLNAMALHLEVLKSKLDPGDPEIEVISKEIKRLDHVVKTFLNFNRPLDLQTKPLDLTALCSELVKLVEPDAASKGLIIDARFDGPLWINGDSDLLKQALLNVVMNAIEAMQPGGKLVVGTHGQDSACVISIVDDGPGIPPEIQDKIFNLYFSTKKTGSGIGLAMTFRLVQLHGGIIEYSSEAGKGTSFRLRFPALSVFETGRAIAGLAG